MSKPYPLTGEWMEIQYIRLQGRRRWKKLRADLPPIEKRKSIMARVKAEKIQRQMYADRRALIIHLLGDLPSMFDVKALAWDVERYAKEHNVGVRTAASEVRAAAKRLAHRYRTDLNEAEHQHVWIKRTVDGFTCTSCSALGTWDGDDNHSMEVVER